MYTVCTKEMLHGFSCHLCPKGNNIEKKANKKNYFKSFKKVWNLYGCNVER